MKRLFAQFASVLVLTSACGLDQPEPEPAREPPEGVLVYEGECARVFRSFEGFVCQGTSERLDARVCLIRDYLGGDPDLEPINLYLATGETVELSVWCGHEGAGGCADGGVAFGYESLMNHEIVHALADVILGHHPHTMIGEGLANVLDGEAHTITEPPDLEALLASSSDRTKGAEAANFVGWLLLTRGPKTLMSVASEVPLGSTQAMLEAALSEHLGMTVEEMIEAYETETAWTYPELPSPPAANLPEQWADGVQMTFGCFEPGTQGLTDEPFMWRTIDFIVDSPGIYLFQFGDARAVWIREVCEDPDFEPGAPPCEDSGFEEFGFTHVRKALEPDRRYRARIEVDYPGPVDYTFLPVLEAEP